jgi:hypothetical protein
MDKQIRMNLQFFADEEIETTESTDVGDTELNTPELEEPNEPISSQEKEKDPFNFEFQHNEENVVIDNEDKLRELAQKGMNYDQVYSRVSELEEQIQDAKQQALDDYIASQNYEWNGKKITTKAEYDMALKESELINELVENEGFTEAQARRIAEAERKANSVEQKLEDITQKSQTEKEQQEFLEWHNQMEEKGVFTEPLDPNKIPPEVWQQVDDGVSLKTAYMEYKLMNIKTNVEQETIKKLRENADSSTGSTQVNVGEDDKSWSAEYIETMAEKHGSDWVKKNYDKIEKSGYYK